MKDWKISVRKKLDGCLMHCDTKGCSSKFFLFGVDILKSNQHKVLGDLWCGNDRVGNWKDTMGT